MAKSDCLGNVLCETMHNAHYMLNDLSWETLNRLWKQDFRADHRYKVWFCASSTFALIMRLGKTEYLVEFHNGNTYCRPCGTVGRANHTIYEKKPCFETVPRNGSVRTRWQREFLI